MSEPFDTEIYTLLKGTYNAALLLPHPYTTDQLKMKIVSTNLKALANTFLKASDHPEVITMNFMQVALGILGTVDFLEDDLPEIGDGEISLFP